jgi:multidrug resistance protein EbrA
MYAYGLLLLAILSEVFGSSMLKATQGFKKLLPSLGVIIGYGTAFYALSLSLKTVPLGMAYAIWAGLGTALTALVGIAFYKEKFNRKKFIGIVLIIGGVILLNFGRVH